MEITFWLYADRMQSDWGLSTGKSMSTAETKEQATQECLEKFPTSEGWYGHCAVAL